MPDAVIRIQVSDGGTINRMTRAMERLESSIRGIAPLIRRVAGPMDRLAISGRRAGISFREVSQSSRQAQSGLRNVARATRRGSAAANQHARSVDRESKEIAELRQQVSRLQAQMRRLNQTSNTTSGRMGQVGEGAQTMTSAMGRTTGTMGVMGQSLMFLPGPLQQVAAGFQSVSFSLALGRSAGLDFIDIIKRLNAALGITVGLLSVFQFATVEDTLIRTARSAGRAGENIEDLVPRLTSLSDAAPRASVSDSADAVLKLARSGVELEEAFDEAGRTALEFARVVDIPADQAIEQLQASVNQTGRSMQDVADIVVKASRETQFAIQDISKAFQRGSLAAEELGLRAEDVGAVVAQVTSMGLEGAQAGTALRRLGEFAGRLGTEMETARQSTAIAELGVRNLVNAFKEGRIDILEFIQRLKQAGAASSDFAGIFGSRANRAVKRLAESIPEIRSFAEELESAEGTTRDAAEALGESFLGRLEEALNAFQRLATTVGALLARSGILNLITGLVTAFAELAEMLGSVVGLLSRVSGFFESIVSTILPLDNSVTALAAAWTVLSAAMLRWSTITTNLLGIPIIGHIVAFTRSVQTAGIAVRNTIISTRSWRSALSVFRFQILRVAGLLNVFKTRTLSIGKALAGTSGFMVNNFQSALLRLRASVVNLGRSFRNIFRERIPASLQGTAIATRQTAISMRAQFELFFRRLTFTSQTAFQAVNTGMLSMSGAARRFIFVLINDLRGLAISARVAFRQSASSALASARQITASFRALGTNLKNVFLEIGATGKAAFRGILATVRAIKPKFIAAFKGMRISIRSTWRATQALRLSIKALLAQFVVPFLIFEAITQIILHLEEILGLLKDIGSLLINIVLTPFRWIADAVEAIVKGIKNLLSIIPGISFPTDEIETFKTAMTESAEQGERLARAMERVSEGTAGFRDPVTGQISEAFRPGNVAEQFRGISSLIGGATENRDIMANVLRVQWEIPQDLAERSVRQLVEGEGLIGGGPGLPPNIREDIQRVFEPLREVAQQSALRRSGPHGLILEDVPELAERELSNLADALVTTRERLIDLGLDKSSQTIKKFDEQIEQTREKLKEVRKAIIRLNRPIESTLIRSIDKAFQANEEAEDGAKRFAVTLKGLFEQHRQQLTGIGDVIDTLKKGANEFLKRMQAGAQGAITGLLEQTEAGKLAERLGISEKQLENLGIEPDESLSQNIGRILTDKLGLEQSLGDLLGLDTEGLTGEATGAGKSLLKLFGFEGAGDLGSVISEIIGSGISSLAISLPSILLQAGQLLVSVFQKGMEKVIEELREERERAAARRAVPVQAFGSPRTMQSGGLVREGGLINMHPGEFVLPSSVVESLNPSTNPANSLRSLISSIPFMQEGGTVQQSGLAFVHEGESVIPAQASQGFVQRFLFAPHIETEVNAGGTGDKQKDKKLARDVASETSDEIERKIRRMLEDSMASSTTPREGMEGFM